MPFKIEDIDPETEFPLVSRCLREAYETPQQTFVEAWMPINGPTPEDRAAAIQEFSDRLKAGHMQDPGSRWQKIIDVETGRWAGVAGWNFHKTNPFAEDDDEEIDWFPDDSSRKYAKAWLEAHSMARYKAAQKPHIYLFNCVTLPEYRRRGVGQMVMDWGKERADELGLDLYLDATPLGIPLYEKNGFVKIEDNHIEPTTENPDEMWKATEARIKPFTFRLMCRPFEG